MSEERKKRLSQAVVIVGAIVLLVTIIAYLQLWRMYSEEKSKQEDLDFNVEQIWVHAQAPIPTPPKDQEARLEAARARLAAAQELEFPTQMGNTEIIEMLFQSASRNAVNISVSSSLSPESEGQGYDTLHYGIVASGSRPAVLAFLTELEEDTVETLEIDQVSLSGAGDVWSASFGVDIHTQLPSPLPEMETEMSDLMQELAPEEEEPDTSELGEEQEPEEIVSDGSEEEPVDEGDPGGETSEAPADESSGDEQAE